MSDERIQLFEDFTLDMARGCLLRAGHEVHLRPQSFEVLKYLVEHRGHLVSKDRLNEEVRHGRAVTDDSLGKCIEEVREALGENSKSYIRNVRGRGYIFDPGIEGREAARSLSTLSKQVDFVRVVVEDEEADEITAPALPPAVGGPRSGPEWGNSWRKAVLAAAGLSVIILTVVVAYRFFANRESTLSRIESIAVLISKSESS